MEHISGLYVMRVASMLTGMHPQTLRKYERAGLLAPSRSKRLRLYSDQDIARLKTIKYLVDEVGLNIAGVRVALKLKDEVAKIQTQITGAGRKRITENIFVEMLRNLAELVSPPENTK